MASSKIAALAVATGSACALAAALYLSRDDDGLLSLCTFRTASASCAKGIKALATKLWIHSTSNTSVLPSQNLAVDALTAASACSSVPHGPRLTTQASSVATNANTEVPDSDSQQLRISQHTGSYVEPTGTSAINQVVNTAVFTEPHYPSISLLLPIEQQSAYACCTDEVSYAAAGISDSSLLTICHAPLCVRMALSSDGLSSCTLRSEASTLAGYHDVCMQPSTQPASASDSTPPSSSEVASTYPSALQPLNDELHDVLLGCKVPPGFSPRAVIHAEACIDTHLTDPQQQAGQGEEENDCLPLHGRGMLCSPLSTCSGMLQSSDSKLQLAEQHDSVPLLTMMASAPPSICMQMHSEAGSTAQAAAAAVASPHHQLWHMQGLLRDHACELAAAAESDDAAQLLWRSFRRRMPPGLLHVRPLSRPARPCEAPRRSEVMLCTMPAAVEQDRHESTTSSSGSDASSDGASRVSGGVEWVVSKAMPITPLHHTSSPSGVYWEAEALSELVLMCTLAMRMGGPNHAPLAALLGWTLTHSQPGSNAHAAGAPYELLLLLPYYPGGDLHQLVWSRLAEHDVCTDPRAMLCTLLDACMHMAALAAHAAAHGVIINDLKLTNVVYDSARGCALLIDVEAASLCAPGQLQVTHPGASLYSGAYAGAEQMQPPGYAASILGKTDVHALGACGRELMAGLKEGAQQGRCAGWQDRESDGSGSGSAESVCAAVAASLEELLDACWSEHHSERPMPLQVVEALQQLADRMA